MQDDDVVHLQLVLQICNYAKHAKYANAQNLQMQRKQNRQIWKKDNKCRLMMAFKIHCSRKHFKMKI